MSIFALAMDTLFGDPNIARDAVYISDAGAPVLIRVVTRRADDVSSFGDARIWSEAKALEFMMTQTRAGAPGQHYSDILNAVGSASQRLNSLFSRKPYWSQILRKTEGRRGWYHLDPDFVIWLLTRHRD